jgi:hypothetical protein
VNAVRVSFREHLVVLLAFALLSVLATWPLAAHLRNGVLGPPGDNYEYVYKIGWFKTALLERGQSPLFNPDVFYPAGYDLSLSETTLANVGLALPFAVLWGEVAAYNLVVLLSFGLSGWAMYWLARHLTGSKVGGAVAGLLFAFSAYRMAHLGAGHLPLMGTQWIPLAFLFVERAFHSRRVRDGALAGLFFGLTALSSWYYAYMVGLFLVVFALFRWAQARREMPSQAEQGGLSQFSQRGVRRNGLAALLAFAVVAGLAMLPAAIPLLRNAGAGATEYTHLAYIDQWSVGVADFFWPSVFNPVWGRTLADVYIPNIHEGLLYLGWVGMALAVVALWRRRQPSLQAYAWLGLIGFVLALGTTLHLAGGPLRIPAPEAISQTFSRAMYWLTGKAALNPLDFGKMDVPGTVVIPMPMLFLYLFFPFFAAMRVPARFGLMAILAVSVLAGGGAVWLAERVKGRVGRLTCAGGLALLLALDLASAPFPVGYSEARGQPVDAWLAAQPKPSPVAQFPLDRTWYGYPLYQQWFHGQPIAYGYGTFVPQEFRQAEEILRGFPDAESFAWLQGNGVKIVLLAQHSLGDRWNEVKQAMDRQQNWEFVGVFQDEPLFHDGGLMARVPPTPAVPSSEWVAGDKKAYVEDAIWVYRLAEAK